MKPVSLQYLNILHGAGTWTLRKIDQKCLGGLEMWCWRRMEKISWTHPVKNDVSHTIKEERNIYMQ
jgi:hypothetical protein